MTAIIRLPNFKIFGSKTKPSPSTSESEKRYTSEDFDMFPSDHFIQWAKAFVLSENRIFHVFKDHKPYNGAGLFFAMYEIVWSKALRHV